MKIQFKRGIVHCKFHQSFVEMFSKLNVLILRVNDERNKLPLVGGIFLMEKFFIISSINF